MTRNSMLQHCRTLTAACNYTEGEVMVCVLDFKKDVGLWHSVLCVSMNSMNVTLKMLSLETNASFCIFTERVQWNARDIRALRFDESQPCFLDADDHEVQR